MKDDSKKESDNDQEIYIADGSGDAISGLSGNPEGVVARLFREHPELIGNGMQTGLTPIKRKTERTGGNFSMPNVYPVIENADEKLRGICLASLVEKYPSDAKDEAKDRMEKELSAVERQGAATEYLLVYRTLQDVDADSSEYFFRGTMSSSLISYLLGFSHFDPMNIEPQVYYEFAYGYYSDRHPWFEMVVTEKLYEKLVNYFDNYPGEHPVEFRHELDGKITGVFIGEIGDRDPDGRWFYDSFHLSFVTIDNFEGLKADMHSGAVYDACHPQSLSEYVKCYNLTHSTGAWTDNAEKLLSAGKASFQELIADREDVFELLLAHDIDRKTAYEIADTVRKGRISRRGWRPEHLEVIKNADLPEWFISSCEKIKYLWPRAHTIALYKWCGEMDKNRKDIGE